MRDFTKVRKQTGLVFLVAQAIGAAGGLLQNFAISQGSVTIVNALAGTQFVFLLLLTVSLSALRPKILRERFTRNIMVQKVVAVSLITIGILLLAR